MAVFTPLSSPFLVLAVEELILAGQEPKAGRMSGSRARVPKGSLAIAGEIPPAQYITLEISKEII